VAGQGPSWHRAGHIAASAEPAEPSELPWLPLQQARLPALELAREGVGGGGGEVRTGRGASRRSGRARWKRRANGRPSRRLPALREGTTFTIVRASSAPASSTHRFCATSSEAALHIASASLSLSSRTSFSVFSVATRPVESASAKCKVLPWSCNRSSCTRVESLYI
jgi:hypothetical protein